MGTGCCISSNSTGLFILLDETLLDTGFLTGEVAEIVKFRTTNLTILANGDRLDERRFHREDTLYTDAIADLADGETLFITLAADLDHNAAILLNTLFVSLFDTVSDSHCVTGAEGIEFFLGSGECLLCNFN